jgi:hypothetical protein
MSQRIRVRHLEQLAESISHIQDKADRARVTQQIGLVVAELYGANFDWFIWNKTCL